MKFGAVGAFGFVVDSFMFIVFMNILENIMIARLCAFWVAASATWIGNRIYTFKMYGCVSKLRQWCIHMLSAHLSGIGNVAIFWITLSYAPVYVAFGLGTAIGMTSNYLLAQKYVFVNKPNRNL